jgi:hypothetical protein
MGKIKMAENQNNLVAKINEHINFYKAHNTLQPIFSKMDANDRKNIKEKNKKLEGILDAIDNEKTYNLNNSQDSPNKNYTNTQTNNKEEKPGLLSRISNKFSSPWVKYPLIIAGGGILASQVSCGGGVTPIVTPVEESYYISGVPYVEQATLTWCLPASGAMVFDYYGVNVTQQQVADKVIKENGTGSPKKLREYAKELGFKAEFRNLTLKWVKKVLQQDVLIILVQDFSLINPNDHARVVIGYDDKKQELITHDPSPVNGKNYTISYSEAIALNNINPPFFCSNMIYPKDVNLNLP